MSTKKDYYKLLGVTKSSNPEEVKKAYHQMAKKCHPDKNPNDPMAAEKFKAIKEAYENLSDPNKKVIYDSTSNAPTANVPTSSASPKEQARYQTSSFPQTFSRGGGVGSSPGGGPKIFAFNVYGANIPMEEMFRMFFGGMHDSGMSQKPAKPVPPNPNAVASCQFCRGLFTVPDLIIHQNVCSKRPQVPDDNYQKMFPDDFGSTNPVPNWRQQHKETVDAIRRDRQRAGSDGNGNWANQPTAERNPPKETRPTGYVECPICFKRLNINIAPQHIQFCKRKAQEDGMSTNTMDKDHNSFKKAKEYAANLKKQQRSEDNNSNGSNNNNKPSWNFDTNVKYDNESDNTESSSEDDDVLHRYWDSPQSGSMSSRSHRKTTLPDLNFYKKYFANRPRRNTSANVYESTFPSFSSKMNSYRDGTGCAECVRIYGLKAASVYCSCQVKRSANVRF